MSIASTLETIAGDAKKAIAGALAPAAPTPPVAPSTNVAVADLAKFLSALFAWEKTNDPTLQATLSGAQRIAAFLAIFDVPGAGAVAAGLGLAREDIPVIVGVGQVVLPELTALASDAAIFAPAVNQNPVGVAGSKPTGII